MYKTVAIWRCCYVKGRDASSIECQAQTEFPIIVCLVWPVNIERTDHTFHIEACIESCTSVTTEIISGLASQFIQSIEVSLQYDEVWHKYLLYDLRPWFWFVLSAFLDFQEQDAQIVLA